MSRDVADIINVRWNIGMRIERLLRGVNLSTKVLNTIIINMLLKFLKTDMENFLVESS
jgi:predicted transcriptional regulator